MSVTRHRYHFRVMNCIFHSDVKSENQSLQLCVININFVFFSCSLLHLISLYSFILILQKKQQHTSSVVHVCRRSASCHTMNSSTMRKPKVHCGKVPSRPASSSPKVTIRRTTNRELVGVRTFFFIVFFKYNHPKKLLCCMEYCM